ncbi:Uncharacterised protein [Edwardsiella tarda]|nr:Uncharacterised protein [Edwardsiella tarda]
MSINTIGIDLAKEVFQIHGTDEHGKRLFNKQLKRAKMRQHPPCLIGLEVCAGAHFMAHRVSDIGHEAKLISP